MFIDERISGDMSMWDKIPNSSFYLGRTSNSRRLLRCELGGYKLDLCSLVTHRKINILDLEEI